MERYQCKNCVFFKTLCKDISRTPCTKFFPNNTDPFTAHIHQLKNAPIDDLLLAKVLVDRLVAVKLQKIKLDLEVGQIISFMYHAKEVKAPITYVNGGVVMVTYSNKDLRLLKSEIIETKN